MTQTDLFISYIKALGFKFKDESRASRTTKTNRLDFFWYDCSAPIYSSSGEAIIYYNKIGRYDDCFIVTIDQMKKALPNWSNEDQSLNLGSISLYFNYDTEMVSSIQLKLVNGGHISLKTTEFEKMFDDTVRDIKLHNLLEE